VYVCVGWGEWSLVYWILNFRFFIFHKLQFANIPFLMKFRVWMKSSYSLCYRLFVSLWALKNLAELSNRLAVCMTWQGQDVYVIFYQSAIPIAVQVTWSQSSAWKFGWPKTNWWPLLMCFWIIALVNSVDFCYLVCIYCTEYFNEFHMITSWCNYFCWW